MSNIYEALEQARRRKTESGVSPQLALQTKVARGISLADEMAWLHHQIDFLLSNNSQKLIQFIGCRRGEGVSTIVKEFAEIAVERYGKSVLILDSACQDPTQKINLNFTCEYGLLDLVEKGELIDKAFLRFGDSNLYFAPISVQASLITSIDSDSATGSFWKKLREKFDLILIDSSSDGNTYKSIAISCKVDGVILVIEAGKTRRKVAESVKKKIQANGGLILGVILNKRRYYIPEFIHRRM